MSFLGEIKRRKVFQVAAVYAVVAWLAVQIVATVEAPLNLPGWVDTLVIVLLLVGFPIAVVMAWAFDLTTEGIKSASEVEAADVRAQPAGQTLNTAILVLMALAVGFLIVDQYVLDDTPRPAVTTVGSEATAQVTRFAITQPPDAPVSRGLTSSVLGISPDGTKIAYRASRGVDGPALLVRAFDSFEPAAVPVSGGAGGFTPFFSPDGEWLGFIDDGAIQRVPAAGGRPQVISSGFTMNLRGAFWGEDDMIVFGVGSVSTGLWQVPADGGTPEPLTALDESRNEISHQWPHPLPGGEAVLFAITYEGGDADTAEIAVRRLDTGEQRILVSGGSSPGYVSSGHLIYTTAGTLWAVPFDIDELTVSGSPVRVIENLLTTVQGGTVDVAVARNGTLAYLPGIEGGETISSAVWVDSAGNETLLGARRPGILYDPAISPDGTQVAMSARVSNTDLWVWSIGSGTFSRLTFGQEAESAPVWTPEGTRIVYSVGGEGLFSQRADGAGTIESVFETPLEIYALDSTEDEQLVVHYRTDTRGIDIGLISTEGEATLIPLLATPFDEAHPALSPDGRWLAYHSDESGRFEIYVRPYPDLEAGKWQISSDGAMKPKWSADGDTLFFAGPTELTATELTTATGFATTTPVPVLDFSDYAFDRTGNTGFARGNYDAGPDGRFLWIRGERNRVSRINAVLNWSTELARIMPILE